MASKTVKNIEKTEDINEVGKKQAEDIIKLYKTFDDRQREAFLLGRIHGMLVLGTAITDGCNETIAQSEAVLQEVRQRLNKNTTKKSDINETNKVTPKKTTAKKGAK